MTLRRLAERFANSETVKELAGYVSKGDKTIAIEGLHGSSVALVLYALSVEGRPILAVAKDEEEAAYLQTDLECLTQNEGVLFFPSAYKRAIRYGHKDLANEVIRAELLELLRSKSYPRIIVTYPEAMVEGVVDEETYDDKRLHLSVGEQIRRSTFREKLWSMGFEEKDYVYTPGDFAVRGSIVDIYSFASEYPVRLDFFDDQLESIRLFEPESQLSHTSLEEFTILASITPSDEEIHSITSLLPPDSLVYVDQLAFLESSLSVTYTTAPIHPKDNEFTSLEELQKVLVPPGQLMSHLSGFQCVATNPPSRFKKSVEFRQLAEPLFHKNFELLCETLIKYQSDGYDTIIMSGQEKQIERLNSIFGEQSTQVTFEAVTPTLHAGFIDHQLKIAVLTDHSIFERYHNYKLKSDTIRKNRAVLTLKDIESFEYGDYVVHQNYGIATFGGLFNIEQNGRQKETVRLNFLGGDSVYVSIHSLHHISKYKSKEDEKAPRLSKLGSSAWDNLKERTKQKVKDIARNLIKLYAERLKVKGFAFSKDSYLQQELEASFMYEDTPDQEQATIDVKRDMERPVPMDRLICGDVGFGKTEVAMRAAFKAVTDGKQVAVLVPTTVLAYQHYITFSKRLKDFPVTVEYLSQARSAKERREILERLKAGKIDILIGTHAITGKKVVYKDLGLLIIDEEQKFGVAIKERLREIRTHLDTLTMTATPIPRTLQFSLMGARDLSNITTPPPNRYPIRTEQLLYDIDVIAEAINAELARDGQVYFIHNRIHNIYDIAADIERAVPGIRLALVHGQMASKEMEKTLLGFIHHDTDLLLATTIVENGIDVPNANTIIINDAHRFGLSDLHQLRGRVGRGNRKAYCLLLTPPIEDLTPNAKRRLQSITSFSELGSGMNIAMQDLDIRGAGNLLGSEQSGFIADLGFNTYKRILEEAVMELKDTEFDEALTLQGEPIQQDKNYVYETVIETDAEAYFPQMFVPGDNERISLYRELDALQKPQDIKRYRDKLVDRFGPLPKEAEELLKVVELRILSQESGVEKVIHKQGLLKLYLVSDHSSSYYRSQVFSQILSNATKWGGKLQFKEENGRRIIAVKSGVNTIEQAYQILLRLTS